MNFAYQLQRHLSAHMRQWPKCDRNAARVSIRRLLMTGQAWLWPEPKQLDLFGEAAHA